MNHYPHHLGDYAKATQGFSMLEHGAYRLLLDSYYSSEAPLPQDDVYAIARAMSPADRKAVDKVLARKFQLRDGLYYNERVEAELEAYHIKAAKNRENGTSGGRPRTNPQPNPEITQSVSKQEPRDNPRLTLAINQEPINNKTKKKHRLPDGFAVSPAVRAWAAKHGYADLEQHLAYFRDWAASSDATKSDWDATFRNAIRANWAKIRRGPSADNDFRNVL